MMKSRYSQANVDHSLFYKQTKDGKLIVIVIYVDDIIITGSDLEERITL